MENIKCIFCNSESDKILINENGYTGRKCPTCNLIYISPRPASDVIVDLYGNDNADLDAKYRIKASFSKTLHARHNLRIINKYAGCGKILEIGAGAGYFLNEARKQGFDAYGIELNSIQADYIKDKLNIPCEQSPLNEKTFNNEKFDIIYHCDVISHFYNPIAEFEKIYLRLKENGFLIFETGNLGDVNTGYFKYFPKFFYPEHLFFFSEGNIETLLEQTGFELIKIYRFSILPQLFTEKILLRSVNYFRPDKTPDNSGKSEIDQPAGGTGNNFSQLLKNCYFYMIYLIKYKLGAIMPKKGRPQTIIVIAKKK